MKAVKEGPDYVTKQQNLNNILEENRTPEALSTIFPNFSCKLDISTHQFESTSSIFLMSFLSDISVILDVIFFKSDNILASHFDFFRVFYCIVCVPVFSHMITA